MHLLILLLLAFYTDAHISSYTTYTSCIYPKPEIRGLAFVECYIRRFLWLCFLSREPKSMIWCESLTQRVNTSRVSFIISCSEMLVQSLPLKQAFWVQLVILEAPIKIFSNRNKCMPHYFGA